jgi:photosystem II stability/assembly factor-like uncharacterized protein
MVRLHSRAAFLLLGAFVLLILLPTPSAARGMKLLTADTGWVVRGNTLYWTADGASQWSDITPVPPGVRRGAVNIESVFFLDTQEGWAVTSYREGIVASTAETLKIEDRVYAIAHTVTSGQTWSFAPFTCPRLPEWEQVALAGPAGLYFLDSEHGWLVMVMTGSTNFAPGKLLATQDGGRTWNWVNGPGTVGSIFFTTTQDGWLAGGPGGQHLYATHDGCKTWEEVSLPAPPEVGVATYRTGVGAPVFVDAQRGRLAVRYVGPAGTHPRLVVYSSEDGGRTWTPSKVLPESDQRGSPSFALVDSAILVLTGPDREHLALARIPLEGETPGAVVASGARALSLAFADTSSGWVLTIDGHLLATHDGGATWKDVTPWYLYQAAPAAKPPASKKPLTELMPGESESFTPEQFAASGQGGGHGGGGASTHTSIRLGFDKCQADTREKMDTWWSYSPYYDTGTYIGGVSRGCSQPNLDD